MGFDVVLIALIVGGIALSGAYVRAEYLAWREHGAAQRRREAALRELHAASLSEQRDALLPERSETSRIRRDAKRRTRTRTVNLRTRAALRGWAIQPAAIPWRNGANAPDSARLVRLLQPPLFSRDTEAASQEIRGRLVGSHPGSMPQKAVDLVRQHQLFEWQIPLLEPPREIDGLLKPHVAIVIALDQEHGRLPAVDRGIGRRFPGNLEGLVAIALLVASPGCAESRP